MSGKIENIGKAHDRLAYSVAEFSRLFQHGPSWGYRLLYSGRIVAVQDVGDLRIPATEVQRVLNSARRYDPPENKEKERAISLG